MHPFAIIYTQWLVNRFVVTHVNDNDIKAFSTALENQILSQLIFGANDKSENAIVLKGRLLDYDFTWKYNFGQRMWENNEI